MFLDYRNHLWGKWRPSDQLLIAMRFMDGRTVAEIADTLRMDQKPLYRRLDRLLSRLRQALEADRVVEATIELARLELRSASRARAVQSLENAARLAGGEGSPIGAGTRAELPQDPP